MRNTFLAALLLLATANLVSAQPQPPPASGGRPYFHAILSTGTTTIITNTATKVLFNTVTYDSNSYYDGVTNFRFTPLLAGKYRVTVNLLLSGAGTASGVFAALIYKNGSELARSQTQSANTNAYIITQNVTSTVVMNGSTDFLEGWAVATGSSLVGVVGGGGSGGGNTFIEAFYQGP